MKLEILFPEMCNLYADQANMRYFIKSTPDLEVINTSNKTVPKFVSKKVDMIYMGTMSEENQLTAINRLMAYKDRLKELIEEGTIVLATGNSLEIFGEYIEDVSATSNNNEWVTYTAGLNSGERKIQCLGIFPFHAVRDMNHRLNSMILGEFDGMKILGNKSQFSQVYVDEPSTFVKLKGGMGNNKNDNTEGYKYNNFFGTYLLGPFLLINPHFVNYLQRTLGLPENLAFEKEVLDAYNFRLSQMEDPGAVFEIGEHG